MRKSISVVSMTPQISINIPTRNSAATLARCLDSVAAQDVEVEVIVADDCSTDSTREIAQAHGVTIVDGPLPLLEARYEAARRSTREFVVLLDSDQFLQPHALRTSLSLLEKHEALVLEERADNPTTWVSKLFAADRRLLHSLPTRHLNPAAGGALLPRVFGRSVLLQALERIPLTVRRTAIAQDHAILWDAASANVASVGIVLDAVTHQEMERVGELWRKYYRWGAGLAELFAVCPHCRELTKSSIGTRLKPADGFSADYIRSLVLLGLKTVPYTFGYIHGRLTISSANRSERAEPGDELRQ